MTRLLIISDFFSFRISGKAVTEPLSTDIIPDSLILTNFTITKPFGVVKLLKSLSLVWSSNAHRTIERCDPKPGILSSNSFTLFTFLTLYLLSSAIS